MHSTAIVPKTTTRKKKPSGYFYCSSTQLWKPLTCFLNCWHSSGVRVSALAISGMTLTFSCNRFMNSMSKGFRLQRDKDAALCSSIGYCKKCQIILNHLKTVPACLARQSTKYLIEQFSPVLQQEEIGCNGVDWLLDLNMITVISSSLDRLKISETKPNIENYQWCLTDVCYV